jgi:hypothetical protein
MAYNGASWNEASPTNDDLANEIDDMIRDVKIAVRSRMEHEHKWSSSQTATGSDGYHAFVTLSTQTSAPGLVYGTATQAGAVYAISSGTGVSVVCKNSGGYEVTLQHSAYLGGGVVPKGGIIMWSGTIATIPFGWALCDGTNGTPNLVDKFVICAKQDDSGTPKTNVTGSLTQTGGAATSDALIAHTHGFTLETRGNSADVPQTVSQGDSNTSVTDYTGTTASAGSGDSFSIMNPYYALAFIQKL